MVSEVLPSTNFYQMEKGVTSVELTISKAPNLVLDIANWIYCSGELV